MDEAEDRRASREAILRTSSDLHDLLVDFMDDLSDQDLKTLVSQTWRMNGLIVNERLARGPERYVK